MTDTATAPAGKPYADAFARWQAKSHRDHWPADLSPADLDEMAAIAHQCLHPSGGETGVGKFTVARALDALVVRFGRLQASLDLRLKADERAVVRWTEATGRSLELPDHVDLVVWLLERLDAQTEEHLRRAAETHRRCADDLDAQEAKHAARVTELLEEERTKAQKMEEVHSFAVRRGCPPGTWIMPWLMDYAASLELMNENAKKSAEELADKHNELARQDSANAVRIHDLERRVRELEEERLATLERWVPRCTDAEAERDLLLVENERLKTPTVAVVRLELAPGEVDRLKRTIAECAGQVQALAPVEG